MNPLRLPAFVVGLVLDVLFGPAEDTTRPNTDPTSRPDGTTWGRA